MKNNVLNPKTDFTPSQLRDWLNEKYGAKITGKPFTNSDVYQYAKRERLPDEYSGATLKILAPIKGVKILRLITD